MKFFMIVRFITLIGMVICCNAAQFYQYSEISSCKGKVGTDFIRLTLNNVSLLECVLACDKEPMAMLLTYDKQKRNCHVHSFALDDIVNVNGLVNNEHGTCFRSNDLIEQWISKVIRAANEYAPYGPYLIKGAPDWYPWIAKTNTTSFIEVEIEQEMFVEYIFIYETGSSVAFSEISLRDPVGNWVSVWTGPKITIIHSNRITNRLLPATNFKTKALRFDIYQVPESQETDAVRVVGRFVQRNRDSN